MITATLILCCLTFLGFARKVWWGFTLFDFPRIHYAIAAIGFSVWSTYLGDMAFALANMTLAAFNFYRFRGFWPRFYKTRTGRRQILVINSYRKNVAPAKLQQTIQDADADILLLLEINDWLEGELDEAIKTYPYRLECPVRDGFRICLLSKKELHDPVIQHFGPDETPLLKASVELGGKTYHLFSAHPRPARSASYYKSRNKYLDEIVSALNESESPKIVMGDFNSVPWEGHFQNFLAATDLKCTLENRGYRMTWPVFLPILGVPMDHILASRDIRFNDLHIGPYVGSDHFPISVNL